MISIVIRAKNEAQYIGEALSAILAQDDREEFEILVLDSGSTDGTRELARRFPVRSIDIPAERFSLVMRSILEPDSRTDVLSFTSRLIVRRQATIGCDSWLNPCGRTPRWWQLTAGKNPGRA